MLHQVHLTMSGMRLTTLVVIGTDCIGSCKSNYHEIITKIEGEALQEDKYCIRYNYLHWNTIITSKYKFYCNNTYFIFFSVHVLYPIYGMSQTKILIVS